MELSYSILMGNNSHKYEIGNLKLKWNCTYNLRYWNHQKQKYDATAYIQTEEVLTENGRFVSFIHFNNRILRYEHENIKCYGKMMCDHVICIEIDNSNDPTYDFDILKTHVFKSLVCRGFDIIDIHKFRVGDTYIGNHFIIKFIPKNIDTLHDMIKFMNNSKMIKHASPHFRNLDPY
jgi:hypothetical protein